MAAEQDIFSLENCQGLFDSDNGELNPKDAVMIGLPLDDEDSDMEVDALPKPYDELRRELEQLELSSLQEQSGSSTQDQTQPKKPQRCYICKPDPNVRANRISKFNIFCLYCGNAVCPEHRTKVVYCVKCPAYQR